jgi:hypothetical protein
MCAFINMGKNISHKPPKGENVPKGKNVVESAYICEIASIQGELHI